MQSRSAIGLGGVNISMLLDKDLGCLPIMILHRIGQGIRAKRSANARKRPNE